MAKEYINYPNPVLSADNNDYTNCHFDISYDGVLANDKAQLTFHYSLDSVGLKEVIEKEQAAVIIHLESTVAQYRKAFRFEPFKDELKIEIPMSLLSEMLIVKGYMAAIDSIPHFHPEELNPTLFGSLPFTIETGDLLALAEHNYRIPLKSVDPLANRTSIFVVRRNSKENYDNVKTVFDDDRILIYLSEETYKEYQDMNSSSDAKNILATLFVVPALIEAFARIEYAKAQYEDYRWFQVITEKMRENNITFKDGYINAANKLIPHVFKSNIGALRKMVENRKG